MGSSGNDMMNVRSMRIRSKVSMSRMVFAAVIGAAFVIGSAGSGARAEDDEESVPFDTKIVRHILKGLGLQRDEASIVYRERPPLVLPGGKDLPPPEPRNLATKTAGWPDDPDVRNAKRRKDAEAKRKAYVEGVDDRPLLPSQYSSPAAASARSRPTGGELSAEEKSRPSSQAELGAKSIFSKVWGAKEEYQTFAGEPPRTSLIEPPAGYRTPSPSQPYGVGKQKWTAPVIDRQELVR